MPRLRSKVLSNSEKNDTIENFIPNPNTNNSKKTRKHSGNNHENSLSISKLKNEQLLTDESSIEFVSISSDLIYKIESSSNEEEISTKNVSKLNSNKSKNSDIEECEKENTKQFVYKTRKNCKSLQNNFESHNEDCYPDGETNKRQLRSRRKSSLGKSKMELEANIDKSKKRRSLTPRKSYKKNLHSSNSDVEASETRSFDNEQNLISTSGKVQKTKYSNNIEKYDKYLNTGSDSKNTKNHIGGNESKYIVLKNKPIKHKHNKLFNTSDTNTILEAISKGDSSQINSNSDIEMLNKIELNLHESISDKRSARIHENSFEMVQLITENGNIKSESSKNEEEMNRSKLGRRSTRIHENSFEAVKDLVTDYIVQNSEDKSDVEMNRIKSKMNRRFTRVHDKSLEIASNENEVKTDITFSPKSPKLQYQDTFTPTINERSLRSKYETSTPATQNKKSLLSKSVTKQINPNQTPRSIIKKSLRRSIQNSTKLIEKKDVKSKITLRKKRSLSEIDLTNTKKSRVTFHPNTSVFHMDSLESTLDDSEISLNVHSTSLTKESTSKKSIDFISINPLNDTYDMEEFANQPETSIDGARLSIKSNISEIDGVHKLNETFSPEDDKVKIREISKRIKICEPQSLVTETSVKKKVYEKTPKPLVTKNSETTKYINSKKKNLESNFKRNSKAVVDDKSQSTINKNNITNSLIKTPSSKNEPTPKRATSSKKMPDFASIHKRNFEKMESLIENVKKRADRAKKLFSIVPETGNTNTSNHSKPTRLPVSSSRLVTTTLVKTPNREKTPVKANSLKPVNRFGFSLHNAKDKKETFKNELKKKQVIRGDLGTLRQKERQYIKGVRSNRRFDLLMKSRDYK